MTDEKSKEPTEYALSVMVNGNAITTVLIGRHYLAKHGSYMNDELILELVKALDGLTFKIDSSTDGVDYFVADIEHGQDRKVYRLIWLFEGESLEVLGVINAYRRPKRKERANEKKK